MRITAKDELSQLAKERGINSWEELTQYVTKIPYGRNPSRTDLSLVFKENKGTCSSKHALLKCIADRNGMDDVKLLLGIYKMNEDNTPGIGKIELTAGLDYIPEAHCYLLYQGERLDFTKPNASFEHIKGALLEEKEISPEQVGEFKVRYHQLFLKKWMHTQGLKCSFEELWKTRENCIAKLSKLTIV